MIILLVLVIGIPAVWLWQRLLIGALLYRSRYFIMYLAYMGMWAYLVSYSTTLGPILLTLIVCQVTVVTLFKLVRHA